MSAHDSPALWDTLGESRLAAALCLLSRGIPLMQAGEEFARTKRGKADSARAGRKINRLRWARAKAFAELVDYYRGLLQIRAAFPALRAADGPAAVFSPAVPGTVAFTLREGKPPFRTLAFCCNATDAPAEAVFVPAEGEMLPKVWEVLADGRRAGLYALGLLSGDRVTVPSWTALILVGGPESGRA